MNKIGFDTCLPLWGRFHAEIPYPDLPAGWEHTNEFRIAESGEYWCESDGGPRRNVVNNTLDAHWIVKRKVEYCPTCGQKKG